MCEVSNDHHFVPVWYQRNFLPGRKGEFYVFDKDPITSVRCPDGVIRRISPRQIRKSGPYALFQRDGFYSVALRGIQSDAIERFIFGPLDNLGARANRLFLQWPETRGVLHTDAGIPAEFGHPTYRMFDVVNFMDAQLARTPRGIDSLRWHFARQGQLGTDNNAIMARLLRMRQLHGTIWSEGHWELFSAASSDVKFLLSDDPVVIYNMDCFPSSAVCQYPHTPNPFWCGSRVIYPLSSDVLLVITHVEHHDNPRRRLARRNRRNARAYDDALVSFTDIVNYRGFGSQEVSLINHVIKSRATRFVASACEQDLFPEEHIGNTRWSEIDELFRPEFPSYLSESEVIVRHEDDSLMFSNSFGERDYVPGWFVRSRDRGSE